MKRKLKDPRTVNLKSLLKWIDKEIIFVEKIKIVNRKKLNDTFEL